MVEFVIQIIPTARVMFFVVLGVFDFQNAQRILRCHVIYVWQYLGDKRQAIFGDL